MQWRSGLRPFRSRGQCPDLAYRAEMRATRAATNPAGQSGSIAAMPRTLFDKIWDAHLVARRADGRDLVYIDRHVLHELHAPARLRAVGEAAAAGAPARSHILDAGSYRRHQTGPRRQHQSIRRGVSSRRCARAAAATTSEFSTSMTPSRASPTSSRRSSAWCCRARPTPFPTAMPAPWAASAHSPSAAARRSSRTSWRRR